jgi:GNAT superfamily N-acetyltransferase
MAAASAGGTGAALEAGAVTPEAWASGGAGGGAGVGEGGAATQAEAESATRNPRAAVLTCPQHSALPCPVVRTGPDFREEHTLGDGRRVVLRHVRASDAPELRAAFERLSPASRYRRFFGGLTALTDTTLHYLTDVDGRDHVAIVATGESPDLKRELGLGVARFVRLRDEPTVAEAAVTVVDDAQRIGLGRLLATTLAQAAMERGVHTFRADVLADNEPMRSMMAEIGAAERATDAGVISYDISLDTLGPTRGGPVDRFLRAAAGSMAVLLRRLGPPEGS